MATELFNGGLVTSRDPATLQPGELQRATNCIYRGAHPSIWRSPGRTRYNSSVIAAAPVKGLRYVEFDQSDPANTTPRYLVAHLEDDYYFSSFSALTGTWSSLATAVGTGESLELVAYNEQRYLLNGNPDNIFNRALYLHPETGTLTARQHGMASVVTPVTVAVSVGSGWPSGAEWGDGVYFFFVTEVDKSTPLELESDYRGPAPGTHAGGTSAITIAGTTDGVTLTFPTARENTNTTHWRVYLVGPKETDEWTDLWFVDATAIGDFDVALTSVVLGNATSAQNIKLPTVVVSESGFTNEANILNDNDVYATATKAANIILSTFGFDTGTITTVRGLEIRAQIKFTHVLGWASPLMAEVSRDTGSTWSTPKRIFTKSGETPNTFYVTAGGPNDLWGFSSWTPASHLTNANFRLRLTTGNHPATPGGDYISIDFARVAVFYSDTADMTRGDNYPVTILNVGPLTTVNGTNGPPPVASTGDIFEGSLVLNDLTDPSIVRFSAEDIPDGFPRDYFLNFDGGNTSDSVVRLRRLHNVLIVLMKNKVARVNSLPRAEDSEFARGRSFDYVDEVNGCVGRQAACVFAIPGKSELLAFVSQSGPRWTDGGVTDTLTDDIDWYNTVNTDEMRTILLTNYPNIFALRLDFVPKGVSSDYPTKCFWLSYHPTKIKEGGKLSVTGPCDLGAYSTTIASLGGATLLLSGDGVGRVHVEDNGNVDPDGSTITPDIVTRDIFPAGFPGEARISNMYLRYGWTDPGVEVTTDVYVRDDGELWQHLGDGLPDYQPERFKTIIGGTVPGGATTLINAGNVARIAPDFASRCFAVRLQAADIPTEPEGSMHLFSLTWEGDETEDRV